MNAKTILREAAIFTAGALTGATGTAIFFKRKIDQIEQDVDELVDKINDIRNKDNKEVQEEKEDISSSTSPSSFKSLIKDGKQKVEYHMAKKNYESDNEEKPQKDISKNIPTITEANVIEDRIDNIEERMEEMVKVEHPQDDIPDAPFEITVDEFVDDNLNEKVGLRYFKEDGALIDEDEEYAEIDNTIGKELFEMLESEDIEELYVRNPNISIDYEIFKEEGSFE